MSDTYITNIYIGKAREKLKFNYSIGLPIDKRGGDNMLDLTITNEQKIKITVNPVTEGGAPVVLDGPIIVTVNSGEATAEVQPDGVSAYLISGDNPGDTIFGVSGDADLGAGVETVADIVTLHVEGARATNLGLILSNCTSCFVETKRRIWPFLKIAVRQKSHITTATS